MLESERLAQNGGSPQLILRETMLKMEMYTLMLGMPHFEEFNFW
jgi:hypothetical protein